MTAPTQATAREAVELPPLPLCMQEIPYLGKLYSANQMREYAKSYAAALLAAKQEEVDKMRAALDKYRGQVDRFGNNSAADALRPTQGNPK